ncbi:hypothetical protein [Planctomyces sp. SH-PL62]|uniref:hypothetical protein n=1 Tax=Planctomyces sp. SH-PL62 TaxID=1636152 RepID=UPI00078E72D2|nr:hypothetical protein [Planctomyces sp. SH-PL62]AMV37543.1 hypothetical protein VT85_08910 [Planctomyces sp. SH-PL62]
MASASGGAKPASSTAHAPVLPAGVLPSPVHPPRPGYEFNEVENRIIRDLGSKMSFVGLFMVGIGLCFAVMTIQRWSRYQEIEVGFLFLAMLFMVFGVWTHRAGRDFRLVVDSQGRDVAHLMAALSSLLKCYRLIYMLFFVGLIFAMILLAAAQVGGRG